MPHDIKEVKTKFGTISIFAGYSIGCNGLDLNEGNLKYANLYDSNPGVRCCDDR